MIFEQVKRVVHCDWGAHDRKRATCIAVKVDDSWNIETICNAGATSSFLDRMLVGLRDDEKIVIGFDFPIGFPVQYGKKCGLTGFVSALPLFGKKGQWERFFQKAVKPEDVSVCRPFYPRSCPTKGFATQEMLTRRLQMKWDDLYRQCERGTEHRPPASPLFWTLGPKAVGTAALLGWQEILQPLIDNQERKLALWPFEGNLDELLNGKWSGVLVETYPGECYNHLRFPNHWSGKTSCESRKARSTEILAWASTTGTRLSDAIKMEVCDGFPPNQNRRESDGEDPFDALIGTCSIIDVVSGRRLEGNHSSNADAIHEGWIFGQKPVNQKVG